MLRLIDQVVEAIRIGPNVEELFCRTVLVVVGESLRLLVTRRCFLDPRVPEIGFVATLSGHDVGKSDIRCQVANVAKFFGAAGSNAIGV